MPHRRGVRFVLTCMIGLAAALAAGCAHRDSPLARSEQVARAATVHVERVAPAQLALAAPTAKASSPSAVPTRRGNVGESRIGGAVAAESQLPDLKPLPPTDVQLAGGDDNPFQPGTMLRFAMATVNAGRFPLEILGTPKDAEANTASQCVAWTNGLCTDYEPVGEVYFHQQHMHWHFRDYARYELRRLVGDRPDWSSRGLAADGGKVSFCMADTGREDGGDGNPVYVTRYNDTCNPVLQGLSPGWLDIYEWYTPGQLIDVTHVADGEYALVETVNFANKLRETDYSNNSAQVMVRLSTAADGNRTVTVLQ